MLLVRCDVRRSLASLARNAAADAFAPRAEPRGRGLADRVAVVVCADLPFDAMDPNISLLPAGCNAAAMLPEPPQSVSLVFPIG